MSHIPQPGTIVDRGYRLQEQLGEGGMGAVYRAVHLITGEPVALKLISKRLLLDTQEFIEESADLHERLTLAREFQTLASLHHPNVIRVLSYGFDEKLDSYFTMEILASAKTILEAGREQSEEGKVRLIAQLLRALTYIHRRGVIHRDIKPGNVLVVGGEVKLLDFGIATNSAGTSELAGTLDYMAPELLLGAPPSDQSDLYAVGVIFHQLLTGQFPHKRESMTSLLNGMLGEDADNTLGSDAAALLEPLSTGNPLTSENLALSPAQMRVSGGALERTDNEHTQRVLADQLQDALAHQSAMNQAAAEISGPLGDIVRKLLNRNPEDRYKSASAVLRELAASVTGELPVETAATRESFLQASVLVGREVELAELAQALKQIGSRAGAAYLLGGESGVGKSRLISELRTLALVHGCWVADGQSVSDGGFLYQEWMPLLRALCFQVDISDAEASIFKDLVPNIETLLGRAIPSPPPIKPEASLARLASTIIGLLKRLTKPLLLILEDLHWGRSESLALLARVAEAAVELPLLIIGTYRSDESPNLPKTLPSFRPMQLQRLQRRDIAQLSESMLGPIGQRPQLVDYLVRQTEGNVFFAVEIVRALAENAGELEGIGRGELPENVLTVGIGQIIERRVDHVSAHYRPLLEFSATLGRTLDLAALVHVFPNMPLRDFLLECSNVAVLESQGSDWRFAHDKLRESILQRLDPSRRAQLHLLAAETLESMYSGKARESFAAALGHHYRQARVLDKALQYYLQAGDSATKIYAYEQARISYAACLELLAQLPETTEYRRLRADVLTKQVQSSLTATAPEVNQQRIAQARELVESMQTGGIAVAEDRRRLARLDYYCARLHNYAGQTGQAIPLFRRVLPVAHEFKDQELILVPSVFLGMILSVQGQVAKAKALLEPALSPMEQLFGKDMDTLRAYLYLSIVMGMGGRQKTASNLIEHVRPWVAEIQQSVYTGMFHMLSGFAMLMAGDWPAAIKFTERSIALGSETKEPLMQYLSWDTNAAAHNQLGNQETALAGRARALEIRRSHGGGLLKDWFDVVEAESYLKLGRVEEAIEQAKKVAAASRPTGNMVSLTVAERVIGVGLARLEAEPATVDNHLRESLALASGNGLLIENVRTELAYAEVARESGNPAAAAAHFQSAKALLTEEMGEYPRAEFLQAIEPGLQVTATAEGTAAPRS
ncbi:MAG TPA: AAA family ATPase [Pseudomonadota bacterium]|nr:AAA family ATPase [Pseudomonadota bacterium]